VLQELVRKGVSKEDIEAGLRHVFGDEAEKLHVFHDDSPDDEAQDREEESEWQLWPGNSVLLSMPAVEHA
jgi:SOS response regulatory protein OraA/RecX